MKKLILLLLFIPLICFGQKTYEITEVADCLWHEHSGKNNYKITTVAAGCPCYDDAEYGEDNNTVSEECCGGPESDTRKYSSLLPRDLAQRLLHGHTQIQHYIEHQHSPVLQPTSTIL